MEVDLKSLIKEENEFWSKKFGEELDKKEKGDFSSYWWEKYYEEIINFVDSKIKPLGNPKTLEAGAGSGKASILLGRRKKLNLILLDVSDVALKYAKKLADRFGVKNISFERGNIFSLPYNDRPFDLVWNIGVIEHYEPKDAIKALKEMLRVTKPNGYIAFGVPNYSSGPMLKARLLKLPFLRFIPGYRVGSEKRYKAEELTFLLEKAASESRVSFKNVEVRYFGYGLPTETPKILLLSLGRILNKLFPKSKFLIFIAAQLSEL
ncbi:class I SAM-dependent methyltransferase [Patescibacteria group bacterium]|nr:MAG: class I SAM-dependent methyltransferase [Patescibacteria group bacterium]